MEKIALTNGQTWSIDGAGEIAITKGTIWLTRCCDSRDYILRAGDTLAISGRGRTVVLALSDVLLTVRRLPTIRRAG